MLEDASATEPGLDGADPFANAERLARAWHDVWRETALVERVDAYRRWAERPDELRRKRELDREIRRDTTVYDDVRTIFQYPRSEEEAAAFYAKASADYRALGDEWGAIESEIRKGFFDGRESGSELWGSILEHSRRTAYPRGEGQALLVIALETLNHASTLEQVQQAHLDAWNLLREIELWELAAAAMSNLGLECIMRSALGDALRVLRTAAIVQRTHALRQPEAFTLAKLAWIHVDVGRPREGAALARRAAELFRETRGETPAERSIAETGEAKARWIEARAALELGEPSEAIGLARRAESLALAIPWEGPDRDVVARARVVEARANLAQGRFEEARRLASEAEEGALDLYRAGALRVEGVALHRLGRSDDGLAALGAARTLLDMPTIQDRLGLAEVLDDVATVHEEQGRLEDARKARLEWLEAARGVLGSPNLQPLDRVALREKLRPGFVAGVGLASTIGESGAVEESAALAFAFLEAARPPADVPSPGDLRTATSPELPDLEKNLAGLHPSATWLEYLHGNDASYVLVVDSRGARIRKLKRAGTELADSALRFLRALGSGGASSDLVPRAHESYRDFLGPLSDDLRSVELLLVSPDPTCPVVPFEALVAEGTEPPRYLVEDLAVAYSASAAEFVRSMEREEAAAPRGFFGLVGPLRDEDPTSVPSSAETEVRAVAALFGLESTVERLSFSALGDLAARSSRSELRTLHVAANLHDFSVLEVMGSDAADGHDLMEVAEVTSLPPLRTELLVLSCRVGEGFRRPLPSARGGFADAFVARGARSVVWPLWPVGEPDRMSLLIRFYRELAVHSTKAEALRAAKLAFLRGDDLGEGGRDSGAARDAARSSKDPGTWAAFLLHGDPR
jgi:CHAT domain-containing protein